MLLLDATHTSHTRAQTGIQRVCRSLCAALPGIQPIHGVCHDPYQNAWRSLTERESRNLRDGAAAGKSRGARWPWHQRLAGRTRRLLLTPPQLPAADGLICPELFSTTVGRHLPELLAAARGPRVAIFYDAIALKYPEFTPPATVARMPGYLRELLLFDGVAAISEDSAACLRDYWQWLGISNPPPVQAIPLGVDACGSAGEPASSPSLPRVLCVSTIEGRKNHLALLDACANLWSGGARFELQLIGMPRPDTAGPALEKIRSLQAASHPLVFQGVAPEADLQAAYRQCAFTVYPSIIEGFGLPVLESLQHGKPCICSGQGALAEAARGGGCITLEKLDAPALAGAIARLLQDRAELGALAAAARSRRFKSWSDYARELGTWMLALPRRP